MVGRGARPVAPVKLAWQAGIGFGGTGVEDPLLLLVLSLGPPPLPRSSSYPAGAAREREGAPQ